MVDIDFKNTHRNAEIGGVQRLEEVKHNTNDKGIRDKADYLMRLVIINQQMTALSLDYPDELATSLSIRADFWGHSAELGNYLGLEVSNVIEDHKRELQERKDV